MKRKIALLLAMLFCFVFAFAGCGGKENNKKNNSTNSSNKGEKKEDGKKEDDKKQESKEDMQDTGLRLHEAEAPDTVPADATSRKDTLVVGIDDASGNLVPYYTNSAYDYAVYGIMFDSLFESSDNGLPESGKGIGSWEIADGGKKFIITMKKGIKYWDGTEMTADDLIWSYHFIADPDYQGFEDISTSGIVGLQEYMDDKDGKVTEISGIKKIDDYKVEVSLVEPNREAVYNLSVSVLPKHYYGKDYKKGDLQYILDNFRTAPMGSGPYKYESMNEGQQIRFVANNDYWKGTPKIPNLIYKYVKSDTVLQELLTGQIDMTAGVDIDLDNIEEMKAAGFVSFGMTPNPGYGYIGFNCTNSILSDAKVRQALTHATNRQAVVQTVYGEYASVIDVVQVPTHPAFPKDHNTYEYDMDKAAAMLDEAGWTMGSDGFRYKDGNKMSLRYYATSPNVVNDAIVPIITNDWKTLGVDLSVEQCDFNTLLEKSDPKVKAYDILFLAAGIGTNPNVEFRFSTTGNGNNSGYSNAELDKLVVDVKKEIDDTKANEMYAKTIKMVNEDVPVMPVYQRMNMNCYNARVLNVKFGMYYDWYEDMEQLELKK